MNLRWINNLNLKFKLLLIVAPTLLGFIVFGGLSLVDKYHYKSDLEDALVLSELAVINSDLVHELQKERGMSAGFLGSKGKSFVSKLPIQRRDVDARLQAFNEFMKNRSFDGEMQQGLNQSKSMLAQLTQIRSRVDSQSIKVPEQVNYYTQLNASLLSIVDHSTKQGADKTIAIETAAFASYLQMKERAGVERAVLSSTFGNDGFKPNMFVRFLKLVHEQNSYQERFFALAVPQLKQDFQQLLTTQTVKDVIALRDIAKSQNGVAIAAQTPENWFSKSTARIDLLRKFEKKLAGVLITQTNLKLQQAQSQMMWLTIVLSVVTLLVLLVSFSVIRFLHQSVHHLYESITKARQNFDLSVRLQVNSKDEFGELAQAFNDMLNDFEKVIVHVTANANTLVEAMTQMKNHSENMLDDVAKGHSESDQVASAMTEMSSTVNEIANNAVQASEASASANSEAEAGRAEVEKTASSIETLAQEIKGANIAITQLDNDIQGIVSVLAVISGIAEQTNLLALNAAIEAARAGEMGRGFAVVADEVRSLAQRAQSSTGDIQGMTERLQQGAGVAVSAIERGLNQALISVEDAKKAGLELDKIVDHVGVIDSMNQQIAAATHEQSAVSEEVNRNALQISEIYRNTQQIAEDLSALNQTLMNEADTMSAAVSKFRVS
ncbi:methyl-accepting chemotaxis protein [Shewanella gelidii]|uniref:Methyl-accepting chemotaxis protein n=1 Tax=Shewanella gelidii TaxID=1642821 RepID=A0A917JWV3_9GAMM|nr:methyl-accepting chemotaxis protein [Shewanella gelidii]MCL1098616.1 methyl-accepting chemotaxis protein [Shewanella gelidii]GGI86585.1 methyl-accepting chemotaxis protein [Shewanella gelidii]